MSYSILGFGAVGQALARMFTRQGLDVCVASTRSPEAMTSAAKDIGPQVIATTLEQAITSDTILLAVPFWSHRDIAQALPSWRGKTVIDVTNAYGVPIADLGGRPSSEVIAEAFAGARLIKAFNHLPAAVLAQDPLQDGKRRVIFVSGDDDGAIAAVGSLAEQLGYAPVSLGRLADGGQLVQARDESWAPLIFQDLFKTVP